MAKKEYKDVDLFYKKRDSDFFIMIGTGSGLSFEGGVFPSFARDIEREYILGKLFDYRQNNVTKSTFIGRRLLFIVYIFYRYGRFLFFYKLKPYLGFVIAFVFTFVFFSGLLFDLFF